MPDFLIQVIAGIIVAIIASFIGIGYKVRISHSSDSSRKTGKKIMIFSGLAIFTGVILGGQSGWDMGTKQSVIGATMAGYGVLFFFIGKVIAWYQRN